MTPAEKYRSLLNMLLMYRVCYYVHAVSAISDATYDSMEDDLRAMEAADPSLIDPYSPTQRPGSDRESDYPPIAQAMARQLLEEL